MFAFRAGECLLFKAGDLTFRGKMPIIYRYGEIKV